MPRAPSLFISHGAPAFAMEPGVLGPKLQALGESLSDVSAVLIVSPHWQTSGVHVMAAAQPETIHDFGGFPAELYQLRYPAPGAPELAAETARLLADAGFDVSTDDQRGYDHGAWVPLRHLFPAAQLPAFQVSMPHDLGPADALRLGRAVAPLRERGVLVIGSGSLTHNLYEVRRTTDSASYAVEFANWVRQAVLDRQTDKLVDYRRQAPHALRAHPTEEHYLPLLVAAGASLDTEAPVAIEGGMTYGVLSMDSFVWGLSQGADERS
jgi:4,5-DOPA dioxygenase extradiol